MSPKVPPELDRVTDQVLSYRARSKEEQFRTIFFDNAFH